MLKLPGVTLVLRDTTCPELARLAVMDSLELVQPEVTLIFSDVDLNVPNTLWWQVPKWKTLKEHCEFFWYRQHEYIPTPFFLSIEWDGWIVDPEQWTNEYLEYDFVGAPWWYDDGHNVGNGIGLRSNRLMEFIAEHKDVFLVQAKEDEVLGRTYRPTLEVHGFKWAPEQLAARFSMECTRPSITSRHFMFHDSFNFPVMLSPEKYEQRLKLMRESPYIRNGKKLQELEAGREALIIDRLA